MYKGDINFLWKNFCLTLSKNVAGVPFRVWKIFVRSEKFQYIKGYHDFSRKMKSHSAEELHGCYIYISASQNFSFPAKRFMKGRVGGPGKKSGSFWRYKKRLTKGKRKVNEIVEEFILRKAPSNEDHLVFQFPMYKRSFLKTGPKLRNSENHLILIVMKIEPSMVCRKRFYIRISNASVCFFKKKLENFEARR